MNYKFALIIIALYISSHLSAQFVVSITSSKTKSCKDSSITFIAIATDAGVPVPDASFEWSFGDNTAKISGLMLDTVTHAFANDGGFIVRVDANRGIDSDYALLKIELGLKPYFTGTTSNRESPICLGQEILLTGKYIENQWDYDTTGIRVELNPALVSNAASLNFVFDNRIYLENQFISDASDIDTIGLNIEHSNLTNLKIEFICPQGNSIILKDFGGFDKYMGEPIDDESSVLAGTGYYYYWTNNPDHGIINSINPAGIALPSGSYTSEQAFTNLVGCSLNGEWKIKITDNLNPDNGFVFSSQFKLNKSLQPPAWEYANTYSSAIWLGNGVSTTSGTGLATAIPQVHGNHRYTFRLKDNYGCFHDTSLIKNVEAVTFSTDPSPPEGDFDLQIEYTSTTTWATTFNWNFGDETEDGSGETTTHTFTRDGTFKTLLTAGTDDGCNDTASVLIYVTIPKSDFGQMPTVFTPNGDSQNDFYNLSAESLSGIQTLDCWIYSRWGKKVAEWHSIDEAVTGWDGNVNGGNKASPGVYFYYIKAVGFDGIEYEKKGSFHLFR